MSAALPELPKLDPVKVAEALRLSTCGMTAENVQGMSDMYHRWHTSEAIGDVYGIHHQTVLRLLRKSGVTIRKSGQMTVWIPEFIASVKALRESGLSWDNVAERAGVSKQTLFNARKKGIL